MEGLRIREAQSLVKEYLEEIGYTKIEKQPAHAFLHLVEEVGETARAFLYRETRRGELPGADPSSLEEEVADILWQTLKVCSYLEIDLEKAFREKYEKNRKKPEMRRP